MKIYVLPRRECEALAPRADTAIISITNPRQKPAQVNDWPYVLRLGFHDIDHPVPGWLAMVPQQANAILHFVNSKPENIQLIIIHCEYANSRSPAVGYLLALWLGCGIVWENGGVPNAWVWKQMRKAALKYAFFRPHHWSRLWSIFRQKSAPAP